MAQTANFLAFYNFKSQKACPTPQTTTPHFVWERGLLRLAMLLFFENESILFCRKKKLAWVWEVFTSFPKPAGIIDEQCQKKQNINN